MSHTRLGVLMNITNLLRIIAVKYVNCDEIKTMFNFFIKFRLEGVLSLHHKIVLN